MEVKVVTELRELNEVLRDAISQRVLEPSEILDCVGKSVKELVEARNVFIQGKDAFVAIRLKKGKTPLLTCLIHNFCSDYKPQDRHLPGAKLPQKRPMEEVEILEFVKQCGNFIDVSAH